MLRIWRSDQLESLAGELAGLVRTPPAGAGPFEPEAVVVGSGGMRRWLSLRLAGHLGIAANIRFAFPAAYVWELICRADPGVPSESPFDPEVLAWRIWHELGTPNPPESWAPLTRWLAGGSHPARRFDLATRIAQVFDGYLVYRHQWPEKWQAGTSLGLGTDEAWQADLWRRIAKASGAPGGKHPRTQFLARFKAGKIPADNLPRRISLFALSDLATLYAETFRALAERIEVNVFLATPSRDPAAGDSADPLLTAWGEQAKVVHAAWGGGATYLFRPPVKLPATLLGRIQAGILSGGTGAVAPVAPDDRSLQVHLCHGPVREMEVLHDRLLDLFDRDPGLTPGNVAILTPDPGDYAPYAEAVFKGAGRIPLSVTDRGGSAGPVTQALLALLDLGSSRWEASRVLTLLENPCVARRFNLTPDDLDRIRLWLDQTGIRWGLDAGHRAELGLPETREHTWEAGLDRLLIGRAVESDGTTLVAGILPFPGVEGNDAQSLERLAACLDALRQSASDLGRAHAPAGWSRAVTAMLEQLLSPEGPDEEKERNSIRGFLASLADTTARAGVAGEIPPVLFRDLAAGSLAAGERSPFPSGMVTFGALVPGRTLPFRVICLAGMNDGAFPRVEHRPGFDLASRHAEPGDRDRRREDLGLLLETLTAAGSALLITCTGRDARDDHEIPPAGPVTELIEHAARLAGSEPEKTFVHVHPLQPFSRRYFENGERRDSRLFSYDDALQAASVSQAGGGSGERPLVTAPIEPPEGALEISVDDLVRFYRNPTLQFLRRLGILFPEDESVPGDREPFDLSEGFAELALRRRIVDALLYGHDTRAVEAAEMASGAMPQGETGRILLRRAAAAAADFADRVLPCLQGEPQTVTIDLALAGVRLTGSVGRVLPGGLVAWDPSKGGAAARVELWIRHLCLCAAGPEGIKPESCMVTLERSNGKYDINRLTLDAVADPRMHLEGLLAEYLVGLREPLHFFPRSSLAAADELNKDDADDRRAYRQARAKWRGGQYPGEMEKPWHRLAFRETEPIDERFLALARALALPLAAAIRKDKT